MRETVEGAASPALLPFNFGWSGFRNTSTTILCASSAQTVAQASYDSKRMMNFDDTHTKIDSMEANDQIRHGSNAKQAS